MLKTGRFAFFVATLASVASPLQAAQIAQIIDSSGDGAGNLLTDPAAVAVDGLGNAYVAGATSDNVFKITSEGIITELIDASDGLDHPDGIAADAQGNVYVAGVASNNVLKITPSGGVTVIMDSTGDGANIANGPRGLALDNTQSPFIMFAENATSFSARRGAA